MTWSSKENYARLAAIAGEQQGFFTTQQAIAAGYVDAVHGYHVSNGDWERCCRGVYRLASLPRPEWPELVIWSLWSRDRSGKPQGIYSHETAAMIHGSMPRKDGPLHMTVPRTFRKNCEIPSQLILHKEDVPEELVVRRDGYAVLRMSPRTSPAALRRFDDIIAAGED